MNIRILVFSFVCCFSGYVFAAGNRADMDQQLNEAVQQYEEHFMGNVSAAVTASASNVRWLIIEGALAALVIHNGTDSVVSKAALSGLGFLGICESLGCIGNLFALRSVFKQRAEFYRQVANIRAGSQMYNDALEDDMPEDI